MTDGLALLTGSLFDLRQLTAGHIPEIGVLQMVFDPVDQVREQSELEVSRPVQFFLLQIPLTAQAEILAVKPLGGLTSFTDREPNKIYTQIDRLW